MTLADGSRLALRLFPSPGRSQASVIIPSAMGVAQTFYADFARWLARQDYLVATFDYRGIGLSAPESLRGFKMNLFDWATQDCAAVIEFMSRQLPGAPLYWLGHSLGGQLLGLIPNRDRIERVLTVAAGSGYWRENSWQTKRVVLWLWYVAAPLAMATTGYFPGKRLRKVGNLPRGVMAQWRRWCLNPQYVVGAEGEAVRQAYASVRMPMLSLSFTDDEMMSAQGIRSLHALYAGAPVEYRRIAPSEVGAGRIGHFGFFRPRFERTLWPLVPRWFAVG